MKYPQSRLRNGFNEAMRLLKNFSNWDSIRHEWRFYSRTGPFGTAHRFIPMKGEPDLMVERDLFDQIWDFSRFWLSLFYLNVWIEQRCSHPHDDVKIEWDGDEETGYYKQTYCHRCQGYLSRDDIDRYLPEPERHPEKVVEPPYPREPQFDDWND